MASVAGPRPQPQSKPRFMTRGGGLGFDVCVWIERSDYDALRRVFAYIGRARNCSVFIWDGEKAFRTIVVKREMTWDDVKRLLMKIGASAEDAEMVVSWFIEELTPVIMRFTGPEEIVTLLVKELVYDEFREYFAAIATDVACSDGECGVRIPPSAVEEVKKFFNNLGLPVREEVK